MKFMVYFLLVASTQAVDLRSRSKQKNGDERTETRNRSEQNSVVDKRAPAISTVSPAITPGIEYADSKESQHDKSPTHQVYATPLPPVSKISDVLTDQGPNFQSAIASHLFAPISIYQPRLGAPATYEVSAPVPSNLAYAEHRVSLQPSQNALQYTQKPIQKPQIQQILVERPVSYPQTLGPIAQPIYQQIPQFQYNEYPINQFQAPLYPNQQPLYQEQSVAIAQPAPPAYNPEPQQQNHQPTQRELKPQAGRDLTAKQVVPQTYVQAQDTVSFAKISQIRHPSLQEQQQQQQVLQYQHQQQPQTQQQNQQQQVQYQQQLQFQPQQAQYQVLQQPQIHYQPLQQYRILPQFEQTQQIQPLQYQLQPQPVQQHNQPQLQFQAQQPLPQVEQPIPQPQHQPQPQYQQQPQPQYQQQAQPQQTQLQQQIQLQPITKAANTKLSYLRPGSVFLQSQLPQNHEVPDYRSNVALPTFPPVQYFGKYAQSIFGNYQH